MEARPLSEFLPYRCRFVIQKCLVLKKDPFTSFSWTSWNTIDLRDFLGDTRLHHTGVNIGQAGV